MNQTKVHLPFLDGIRGIAILAVFLFHSLGTSFGFDSLPWNGFFRDFHVARFFLTLYPLTYGNSGVAIFFAVSGFCIHLSYQQCKEKGWIRFINQRFFRIYPPYLLAIMVFFFLWPWQPSIHSSNGIIQLGTHLLAIHNLQAATFSGINGSFWSIAVEIQLYAIYPILLFITHRYGWRNGLVFVGCIEFLIRAAVPLGLSLPHLVTFSPFAYWFSWSIGAYVAQCYLHDRASGLSRLRFDVISIAAILLPLFKPTANFSFMAISLVTCIAIDRLISGIWEVPKNSFFGLAWNHLRFLGVVSYSFYLFHQPILNLLFENPFARHPRITAMLGNLSPATINIHPLMKFFICCAWYPVIFILSYFIYRFVEQPSIAFGKAAWKKMQKLNKPMLTPAISSAPDL